MKEIEILKNEMLAEFEKKASEILAKESTAKFEVGKWYKHVTWPASIGLFKKLGEKTCGKGTNGNWIESQVLSDLDQWTLMTPDEIKAALVAEAGKRGFKEGVNIKRPWLADWLQDRPLPSGDYRYNEYDDCLDVGGRELYKKGEWATVKVQEPVITIGGYKAEYSGSCVKFGCKAFIKRNVEALDSAMSLTNAESVTIAGQTITREQVQQILKGFNP